MKRARRTTGRHAADGSVAPAAAPQAAPQRRSVVGTWTRRIVQVALPVAAVGVVLVAVPAANAEGPGYGGGADKLNVSWEAGAADSGSAAGSSTPALPSTGGGAAKGAANGAAAAGVPTRTDEGLALVVDGVGFRGLSEVSVRVGSDEPFTTRVDDSGTLDVGVPLSQSETAKSGTSVVATGRSPSGTSMTLVGSIPPRPAGVGPVDLVPWVAAAVAIGLAGSWLVSRLSPRRVRTER